MERGNTILSTPNTMLIIPMCWLDDRHITNNIVEYILINDKPLPLYGLWYCTQCKKRLDDIAYTPMKHERFREIVRVPTESHLRNSDNI